MIENYLLTAVITLTVTSIIMTTTVVYLMYKILQISNKEQKIIFEFPKQNNNETKYEHISISSNNDLDGIPAEKTETKRIPYSRLSRKVLSEPDENKNESKRAPYNLPIKVIPKKESSFIEELLSIAAPGNPKKDKDVQWLNVTEMLEAMKWGRATTIEKSKHAAQLINNGFVFDRKMYKYCLKLNKGVSYKPSMGFIQNKK